MTCKPLNLAASTTSYISFNLQPPRTPGRRTFPSVQFITRPLSIILFTIIRQCTHGDEAIYLIHPRLNDLALQHDKTPKYIVEESGPLEPTTIAPAATIIISSTTTPTTIVTATATTTTTMMDEKPL